MAIDRAKEQQYLNFVRAAAAGQKEKLDEAVKQLEQDILRRQTNLKEHRSSMKYDEIPQRVAEINNLIDEYERQKIVRGVLASALGSPYFGKIIFNGDKHYIGKFGICSEDGKDVIVNDWRAPISSLFYDWELGAAHYISPDGKVDGSLTEKLQFKIENSRIEFIIDTSLTINDEILLNELAQNTSNSLKTIVATIQKKQNEAIRQALSKTTVVQGVAGSGKTSIALHRIAFLLYNNRKNLTSQNILIFSPGKVFSSYISQILPELGEQNVKEICFDDVFKAEFGSIINFETRPEQIERLLKHGESKSGAFKNSPQFTERLTAFLEGFFKQNFKTRPVTIGKKEFSAEQLAGYMEGRDAGSINDKMRYLANAIVALVSITKQMSEKGEELLEASAYSAVLKMLRQKNIFKIYSQFLAVNKLAPFNPVGLAAEDAYALLYIKNYIFGANADNSIKHVVVDEMQDYNATALAIINQMHSCPKTILGDFHQVVDGEFNEERLQTIEKIFCNNGAGTLLKLTRNYRSTYENNAFANAILGLTAADEPIRHGEAPAVMTVAAENYSATILNLIEECVAKGYASIAVLTKNSEQAAELYSHIGSSGRTLHLILPKTEYFEKGIVVAAAHLVKGLEFDAVILCDVSAKNYENVIDRQSLYIGATRALHKIYAVGINDLTEFING